MFVKFSVERTVFGDKLSVSRNVEEAVIDQAGVR
jgi:hypothetical protein